MPTLISQYQEDVPNDGIGTISGGNYTSGGSGVSTNTNSTGNVSTTSGTTSGTSSTPTGTSAIVEPDLGGTKPITTTGNIQGGLYPECLKKWEDYASTTSFISAEVKEKAKNDFIANCLRGNTSGASAIVEPNLGTPTSTTTTTTTTNTTNIIPNLGAFLGSLTGGGFGGGSGAGATEEGATNVTKKPFPYWILIVGAVGAYLIFKKEK